MGNFRPITRHASPVTHFGHVQNGLLVISLKVNCSIVNKIRSFQIAIAFVVLVLGVYFGYQAYASRVIDGKKFSEIEPGKVTLLGVDAGGQGYKIIVSNEIAQLVQVSSDKFDAPDQGVGGDDESDATDKRHVPLKEMIQSLQGDTKALSELVIAMNDDLRKAQEDIPANPVVWTADDLKKAIAGDKVLTKKFIHDTNTGLDGTPADFIDVSSLYAGIVIDLPVPVKVAVKGVEQTLTAHVRIPFRTQFTIKVEKSLSDKIKNPNPTNDEIRGFYLAEAQKEKDTPQERENVAKSIQVRIGDDIIKGYAEAAERVLAKTKIILNEDFIQDAHKDTVETDQGKTLYDLVLNLTDEGRDRLWQYSRHRVGTQLLLIVNGVAIAAPKVRHELAQSQVAITQMVDPDLVDDAVSTIKAASKKS